MFFMVVSRIAYALPLICYGIYRFPYEAVNYVAIWAALFLSTVLFFSFGRFRPWLLTHVTFIVEAFLLFQVGTITGDSNWFLFVLLTSFFAIDALRNEAFHIFLHLSLLALAAVFMMRSSNLGLASCMTTAMAPYILLSPLLCRGVVSAIESKDVVIERIIKKTRVLVPSVNEDKLVKEVKEKERRKYEEHRSKMKEEVDRLSNENVTLRQKLDDEREDNSLDEAILEKYFKLCAEPPSKLSKSLDENVEHILRLSLHVLECEYSAFIAVEDGDAYLSNSVGTSLDEDALVDSFSSEIYAVIGDGKIKTGVGGVLDNFALGRVYFVPVTGKEGIVGVLVFCTKSKEKINGHYANLALVCGYRIAALFG